MNKLLAFKNLVLLGAFSYSHFLFAANPSKSVLATEKKFQVFVSGLFGRGYRLLTNYQPGDSIVSIRDKNEIPRWNQAVSISFRKYISKRSELSIGIKYFEVGYKTKREEILWPFLISNGSASTHEVVKYWHIGIPVSYSRSLTTSSLIDGKNKFTTMASFGVLLGSYLHETRVRYTFPQAGDVIRTKYVIYNRGSSKNRIQVFGFVGFDLRWKVFENLLFGLEPKIYVSMTTLTSTSYNEYLYMGMLSISAGISIGNKCRLREKKAS